MSELGMSEIPIHCVIEALSEGCCIKCSNGGDSADNNRKLLDSYAIVAGRTPLSKLNDAVLTALGFPQFASAAATSATATLPLQNEAAKAKGLIVIDNWKPLPFDQITDNLETPIEHLFKHIGGNRWTLKIMVSATAASKSAISPVAVSESVGAVGSVTPDESAKGSGEQETVTSITESSRLNWYSLLPRYHPYFSNYEARVPKLDQVSSTSIAAFMANRLLIANAEAAAAAGNPSVVIPTWPDMEKKMQPKTSPHHPNSDNESNIGGPSPKFESAPQRRSVLVAPRSSAGTSSGSRHAPPITCRLMFDPLTELPMLNEWFENNSHPTCHDIEKYTEMLNSKPYRRTYPPVSTHNVKIWFKNRRAKCKRV